jgi:hypothetical protein
MIIDYKFKKRDAIKPLIGWWCNAWIIFMWDVKCLK